MHRRRQRKIVIKLITFVRESNAAAVFRRGLRLCEACNIGRGCFAGLHGFIDFEIERNCGKQPCDGKSRKGEKKPPKSDMMIVDEAHLIPTDGDGMKLQLLGVPGGLAGTIIPAGRISQEEPIVQAIPHERRRADFLVRGRLAGFHERASHRAFDVGECAVVSPRITASSAAWAAVIACSGATVMKRRPQPSMHGRAVSVNQSGIT